MPFRWLVPVRIHSAVDTTENISRRVSVMTDTTLDAVDELVKLRADNELLRTAINKAANHCIDIQNYCHGIRGAGGAKREARDLECMLRKAINGSPATTDVVDDGTAKNAE